MGGDKGEGVSLSLASDVRRNALSVFQKGGDYLQKGLTLTPAGETSADSLPKKVQKRGYKKQRGIFWRHRAKDEKKMPFWGTKILSK